MYITEHILIFAMVLWVEEQEKGFYTFYTSLRLEPHYKSVRTTSRKVTSELEMSELRIPYRFVHKCWKLLRYCNNYWHLSVKKTLKWSWTVQQRTKATAAMENTRDILAFFLFSISSTPEGPAFLCLLWKTWKKDGKCDMVRKAF